MPIALVWGEENPIAICPTSHLKTTRAPTIFSRGDGRIQKQRPKLITTFGLYICSLAKFLGAKGPWWQKEASIKLRSITSYNN
jgi:hypothetical protein